MDKEQKRRYFIYGLIVIALYFVLFTFIKPDSSSYGSSFSAQQPSAAEEASTPSPEEAPEAGSDRTDASGAENEEPESGQEQVKILGMTIPDILLSAFFLLLIYFVYAEDKSGKKRKIITRLFGSSVADFFAMFEIKSEDAGNKKKGK